MTGAAVCSRAAVFTTSPDDHPLALAGRAPSATSASPVLTAVRICEVLARSIAVADRERRAHGALGVVLVRDRRAEHRHHRVADELLDRAAVALELGAQARVVRREHRAHVLRVEPFGARRRADEVGEEDRDDLPLLARRRRLGRERGAAHPAEAEALRVLLSAGRTRLHGRTLNRSGEPVEELGRLSPSRT